MVINSKELIMTFDLHTIDHLGIKMYSTLPPVIAELVANSYDADAENVKIILLDNNNGKEIIIEDDGIGMSFMEINSKFLKIGRSRRYDEGEQKTAKGRKVIGKKGLGKLSFFGVAKEIEIYTKKGGKENAFVMEWNEIKNADNTEYHPRILFRDKKCTEKNGTKIILKDLQRETDFNSITLSENLSKLFIVDPDFNISVQHNLEEPMKVENEKKYSGLDKEVEWKVPEEIKLELEYKNKDKITGHLIATKYPISPKTNMRGITLFSRKKLVNAPEYFSDSTSSHFFSYLTGWLEVDFIDDLEDDVISTNRQSLNWNHPEMIYLRNYLSKLMGWLEKDWREKRAEIREKELTKKTGIDIHNWFSKLPEEIKKDVQPIVQAIVKDSELPEESNQKIVQRLHTLAPEYIYWHYRHLHPEIQDASREKYEEGDYYRAFQEAIKRYINNIRSKVNDPALDARDHNMIQHVFGSGSESKLRFIESKYIRSDGCEFNPATKKSVVNAQEFLSKGVSAEENTLSHEEILHVINSGLFTEKDCLDLLSILSHLSKRLGDFEKGH